MHVDVLVHVHLRVPTAALALVRLGTLSAAGTLAGSKRARPRGRDKQLLRLFDDFEENIHANTHTYVVVCQRPKGSRVGLLVDSLNLFAPLDELISPLPAGSGYDTFVDAIGRMILDGGRADVLVLDLERLLDEDARRGERADAREPLSSLTG